MVPPSSPNVVSREFTRTRSIVGGNTRGVTALRSTEKDLDSTIIPSAHGYSTHDGKLPVALSKLAMSTRASFLRQLGGHRLAAGWDGRALRVADTEVAAADALIGLGADALTAGHVAYTTIDSRLQEAARRLFGLEPA